MTCPNLQTENHHNTVWLFLRASKYNLLLLTSKVKINLPSL